MTLKRRFRISSDNCVVFGEVRYPKVQGDQLYMAVFFLNFLKCPVYDTVHVYTSVTFYKVQE